jgi:tetratricopeptide (TPR) repeat protein
MEGLIADWYWMRALQYLGDKLVSAKSETINLDDLRELNPRLLYPYLENATDLDPHFVAPYSYGALVLPTIDPEKAIAITRKGIANNPDQWRLYQHLGYIYWKLGRYDEAAEAYDTGSQVPGAPQFMKLMSASMRTEGGSRETAREVFRQMLHGSNDPAVKITAERRLAELDSLDERDAIDKALSAFSEKNGRCVNDLVELVPMLMQVRLPGGRDFRVDNSRRLVDPTGAPYLLDRESCRVKLDVENTGLPISDARTQ